MSSPINYVPHPIDTSQVDLSADLQELLELLAWNAHEVWAAKRQADGWRYGPNRDDDKKLHPDLIAYQALPETEKTYDRAAVLQTLKLILYFGYEIKKAPGGDLNNGAG